VSATTVSRLQKRISASLSRGSAEENAESGSDRPKTEVSPIKTIFISAIEARLLVTII